SLKERDDDKSWQGIPFPLKPTGAADNLAPALVGLGRDHSCSAGAPPGWTEQGAMVGRDLFPGVDGAASAGGDPDRIHRGHAASALFRDGAALPGAVWRRSLEPAAAGSALRRGVGSGTLPACSESDLTRGGAGG